MEQLLCRLRRYRVKQLLLSQFRRLLTEKVSEPAHDRDDDVVVVQDQVAILSCHPLLESAFVCTFRGSRVALTKHVLHREDGRRHAAPAAALRSRTAASRLASAALT